MSPLELCPDPAAADEPQVMGHYQFPRDWGRLEAGLGEKGSCLGSGPHSQGDKNEKYPTLIALDV